MFTAEQTVMIFSTCAFALVGFLLLNSFTGKKAGLVFLCMALIFGVFSGLSIMFG